MHDINSNAIFRCVCIKRSRICCFKNFHWNRLINLAVCCTPFSYIKYNMSYISAFNWAIKINRIFFNWLAYYSRELWHLDLFLWYHISYYCSIRNLYWCLKCNCKLNISRSWSCLISCNINICYILRNKRRKKRFIKYSLRSDVIFRCHSE